MMALAEAFSLVMGRHIACVQQPIEQVIQSSPENALMMDWFNEKGYQAVIPALRALYPSLLNIGSWLREIEWKA